MAYLDLGSSNMTTGSISSTASIFTTDMVTTQYHNGTTEIPPSEPDLTIGFIAAVVAVLFFGSNFIVVKKYETGDGMFFQWVMCTAIWCAGLITHAVRGFPIFYPLAMIGGVLWCTGNVLCVPIIHMLGIGKGLLIWASFNLLSGWLTGRFGLLGLKPEIPSNVTLNYLGMGLCLFSAFIYVFIKSNVSQPQTLHLLIPEDPTENDPLLPEPSHIYGVNGENAVHNTTGSFFERLSSKYKFILGVLFAAFAGLLFGVNFLPVIYIQDNYPNASQNGLDYVFSHFCGIYATSTFYFLVYCAFMRNRPHIYAEIVLPGFVSGAMWAVADIGWFIANTNLSEAVSFPIISSGPGIISALWGVFLFKEITGLRNLLMLGVAFAITISGAVVTGFSKH